MASKLVPVEFLQKYRMYTVGEIAGFSPEKAKSLCSGEKPIARPAKVKQEVKKDS